MTKEQMEVIMAGKTRIGYGNESAAKDFEFAIISEWKGYNSANDKTNVAENVMVQGSQNMYKKLSGNLAVRPGQKRIGAADPTASPVSSEFVWNTSWGATYPVWVTNNKLQVSINNVWYTLLSSLTKTRYVFDKWWNDSLQQDELLFVKGDSDIQSWGGGQAQILSTTANTITKTGTASWTEDFFLPSPGNVVINGNTYAYTGGEGTTTLTGVTPTPVGEANGSIVLQAVVTSTNTPAAGFSNDFIKVINNQVYVGSYTSRLCYISADDDFTNYVVPDPAQLGDPAILTLDSTLNGIGVKSGNAAISIGTSEWAIVEFILQTIGTTAELTPITIRNANITINPIAKQAAAYAHEFIGSSGDNLIYLSKDQQLRTLGNFNDLFYAAYPCLSQELFTELQAENFTGGGIKCIGDFTYLTAPVSGKAYLYQVRQYVDDSNTVRVERLWHSPFIWNATRVDDINGVVVAFSNANPQVYEVWDTGQWHDDSPSGESLPYSCILALSYRTGERRQGLQSFDKNFSEGYITVGTPLNLTINYNWQGSTQQIVTPVNSIARPAFLFSASVGSLGDSTPGDKILGDEITDETVSSDLQDLFKFKVINSLSLVNCFEYQPIYSSDTADAQWEILASGTNAKIETEQQATFIINKMRN